MNLFFFILLCFSHLVFGQNLWEHSFNNKCEQTKFNVDEVNNNLIKKYGKNCEYLKDATRIVIGNFFKCPGDVIHSYFRSKENCEIFFSSDKKELVKFAPTKAKNPKLWVKTFGNCMETATPGQINKLGPNFMNKFCLCVAEETTAAVNSQIINSCSKKVKSIIDL